ncbi:MAG: hypothetical protein LH472_04720 [Pyrinomonadaceae bacterium]|nr:hypothetical protein [Pyrinomonadaceae bacterium]
MKIITFDGVDLEDSFILGWYFDFAVKKLVFDLEVSLWQGNKYYTPPVNGEYTCYKRGTLVFDDVQSIDGLLPMDSVKHTNDIDGSIDYGNVESLRCESDDTYKVDGDFGEVSVHCRDVRLEINDV